MSTANQVTAISVFDEGLIRGDGCFEVIRSYRGHPFAFDLHFRRLLKSANVLELEAPRADLLFGWLELMADGTDCLLRVVLTRGRPGEKGKCLVLRHPLPPLIDQLRLKTVHAPWHPGGTSWNLAGVKTISYAPNIAAGREARNAGFDDALLVSREGHLLEGPTFSVAWVVEGKVHTPDLDLGILDSVTRRVLIESTAGTELEFSTERYPVETLAQASEVIALSTIKQVTSVIAVDDHKYRPGEVTKLLARVFSEKTKEVQTGKSAPL